ncbi:MAG TPA: radical SAM protein [Candidatus Methylomirabilis sp.]|nr:radical SAM protein [Candidatus Methylomirabilis sp.]
MNPQDGRQGQYGLRPGAEEFPLMVVISIIYPCNFGCPNCPYTDTNSPIRVFYHERQADLFPVDLWNKMAQECGQYRAWMRCTGGGEPMLHPHMVDMIEFAKAQGARIWLNTNGSMFGPTDKLRRKLDRIVHAGIDLIEFSMDAGDAATYAKVRPPHGGPPRDPEQWWAREVANVRAALDLRSRLAAPTRVVVSIIRQKEMEGKLEAATRFWLEDVGVDEVITRKFLTWDDNTSMSFGTALDPHLYAGLPQERKEPCVWPFERLNVDTLGRIALCGQDISFRTAELFPNVRDTSLKAIWQGERFNWYRRMHLEGRGAECWPCRGCSAWLAGIRDWQYGWLQVLKNSGERLREMMRRDLGVEVEIYQPAACGKPCGTEHGSKMEGA